MSRESMIVVIGLVVSFVPVLGIPEDWKKYTLVSSGILLAVIGYLLRRSAYYRKLDNGSGELSTDSFVESRPTSDEIGDNLDDV